MKIKIGVDESGTGAWAGPFTVAAVAVYEETEDYLRENGVADSKSLSAEKRKAALTAIADVAAATAVRFVEVPTIKEMGQAEAHFDAVKRVVIEVLNEISKQLGDGDSVVIDIIIDGTPLGGAKNWLLRGHRPKWEAKADVNHPVVAAASILAKTSRSERMQDLGLVYEGYGFEQHDGYGTAEHKAALDRLGPTPEHRTIKHKTKTKAKTKVAPEPEPQPEPKASVKPKTTERKRDTMAATKTPKKATKKAAKKAPAKKGVTKAAAKAAEKSTASERFSRDPDAMAARLVEKINTVDGFAAHGLERAQKFEAKAWQKKFEKSRKLLGQAAAALT